MKGLRLLAGTLAAIVTLASVPVTYAHADEYGAEEIVSSVNLYHTHTDETGNCYEPVYHVHSGTESSNGGCYTQPVYYSYACNGSLYISSTSYMGTSTLWYTHTCSSCGQDVYCLSADMSSVYKCNRTIQTSTILKYSLGCGKTTETIESYNLICPIEENVPVGTLNLYKKCENEKYVLTVIPTLNDSILSVTGYEWSTGSTENKISIEGNGTYSCTVTYLDGDDEKTEFLEYEVTDYDTEPPVITDLTPDKTAWTNQNVIITVTATDNYGVAAYRLDSGEWVTENKLAVTQNGLYTVYAKDVLGNISEGITITISNIDKTVPVITIDSFDTDWTKENIVVTFSATDNSNDTIYYAVSESGALTAGDVTGSETSCTVTQNGTYYVYAADKAGNVAKKIFNVSNIDKIAPVITVSPFSTNWTNQDINISYSATDNSNDTLYYAVSESDSLTASEVTGSVTSFTATENGTYYVYAADLAGNLSREAVTVSNIDKEAPVITVEDISTAYTKDAYDIVYSATDNLSGVTYYAVSLSGTLGKDDITSTDTSYEVSENNLYYVYAVDGAGNVAVKEVLITNFDHTPPTGTLSLINGVEVITSEKTWTDKVTASVLASDNIALADNAYNFDSEGYIAANSKVYDVNGNYSVKIKDHVGNEKELTFSIDNIDSTDPTIGSLQFEYEDENGNTVTTADQSSLPKLEQMDITYTAGDSESGLHALAYRYKENAGEWSDWGSEARLPGLLYNGTYTIEVRDGCGNTASKTVTVTNLLEEFPVTYLDVDENGVELGSKTVRVKLGSMAAGSEMGIDPKTGAYYEGYDYINCDTITVGTGENVVHRYFKLHNYSVIYYDDSHNIVFEEYVPFGKQANAPETPAKKSIKDTYFVIEFEFAGWVDRDGNPVDVSSVKNNLTLYPTYTEKKTARTYTVQFCVDGVVVDIQEVIAGEDAVAPENPGKGGYLFAGWDRSFTAVTTDMTVNAIFTVNPYSNTYTEETTETTEVVTVIPSAEDIELLANTEVEYIESKITSKNVNNQETNSSAEEIPDLEELLRRQEIYSEDTPLSGFFKPFRELYENERTRGIAITTTAALGMAASYSIISVVCSILGGFSLTQILIFGYMLLRKKVRFVRGAWLTDTENVRYVDKYGRTVTVERDGDRLIFKRKGKVLYGVDVNNLLEKLNSNKISYKEFEDMIAESEIYTSFSKDLEIETWNVKAAHGKVTSKAKGFSMTKNLRKAFDSAGSYAVRLTQNGKQAMFEVKYAMASV